jgi:hypothetical protein
VTKEKTRRRRRRRPMMLDLQKILNISLDGVCLVMDNARSHETFKRRHRQRHRQQHLKRCCSVDNYRAGNRWACMPAMGDNPTIPRGGSLKATIRRSKSLDDGIFSCSSPPPSPSPISSCQERKQINSTGPLRVPIRQASRDLIFEEEELKVISEPSTK